MQKYEKGTNRISASKLYEIAKALNVEVATLFEDAASAYAEAGMAGDHPQAELPSAGELRIANMLSLCRTDM